MPIKTIVMVKRNKIFFKPFYLGVEFDIDWTKDKKLIIFHDSKYAFLCIKY